ncbi:MAG TPA: LamG domain-containing protein [Polyangia bacterium]|nr:LamG domain-containing protein [Polyangia bacterium]
MAFALLATVGGCSAAPIEVATLGQNALTNGLVAHWAFDEGNGAVAGDGSGNGHNGALQGPAWSWMPTGRFGAAIHLSGADVVAVAGFPSATFSYTVSAWVFIASSELGAPVANLLSTEVMGGGWALYTLGGNGGPPTYAFRYAVNAPQVFWNVFCGCLVPDVWTHVAAVVDGEAGTLQLYVGAAPPITMPVSTGILAGSTTLNIGRSTLPQQGAAFPFLGALDDVAIYNRALGAEEIAALGGAAAPNPR